MRLILAVGISLLAVSASAQAGLEGTMLNGLEEVAVLAWSGPDEVTGLEKETLRSLVEGRLTETGVSVRGEAEARLMVDATVNLSADGGTCFSIVKVFLNEPAKLERNGFFVTSTSWSNQSMIEAPPAACAALVRKAVLRGADEFADHLLVMNGRRK